MVNVFVVDGQGRSLMAQTAAHLVGQSIPHVPVRQWVRSLPIPLRLLLAAQLALVTPALQVMHALLLGLCLHAAVRCR